MIDGTAARAAIRAALAATASDTSHDRSGVDDIAFHMTDWIADLERFHAVCTTPDAFTAEEISDVLYGFLIHVPNHVAAAGKLLTGFATSDIFEVGAVECAAPSAGERPGPKGVA